MSARKPLPPYRTPAFRVGDFVRHVETGNVYQIRFTPSPLRHLRDERTGEQVYQYASSDRRDTTIWIRPQSEMEDGRFERVTP